MQNANYIRFIIALSMLCCMYMLLTSCDASTKSQYYNSTNKKKETVLITNAGYFVNILRSSDDKNWVIKTSRGVFVLREKPIYLNTDVIYLQRGKTKAFIFKKGDPRKYEVLRVNE